MTARSFFGTSGLIYEMKLHDALIVCEKKCFSFFASLPNFVTEETRKCIAEADISDALGMFYNLEGTFTNDKTTCCSFRLWFTTFQWFRVHALLPERVLA